LKKVNFFLLLAVLIILAFFLTQQEESWNQKAIRERIKEEIDVEISREFGRDYQLKNLKFYNGYEWAAGILKPITFVTDEAMIILKREKGEWIIFFGPDTAGILPSKLYKQLPPLLIKDWSLESEEEEE